MYRLRGIPAVLAALLALAGCADAQTASVRHAAESFGAELTAQDFIGACARLAPATRARVERAGGCPDVLRRQHPAASTQLLESQVWGDRAQVHTAADTIFLIETSQGWKVSAAGCRSRGEAPYDCSLEGP